MSLTLFVIILLGIGVGVVKGKNQYVQPLNMGMQVAIPYDIANIWNRPVNFARTSAVLTTLALLGILFFGVITSPFGYFFGIPSEKYVMGGSWANLTGMGTMNNGNGRSLRRAYNFIDFEEIFNTLKISPESEEDECRKMIICSAHKGLNQCPSWLTTRILRLISKRLMGVKEQYRGAIINGLGGQLSTSCEDLYSCNDNLFGILIRSTISLMPKWSRRKANAHFL